MKTVLALALLASTAHADDRTTTVTLGGSLGAMMTPDDGGFHPPRGIGGPQLTLAWETAPLAAPTAPEFALDGALAPELFVGALAGDAHAEALLGAGLRAELRISHGPMGWLNHSGRLAMYASARGMVIGEGRDPAGELALGDYFYLGSGRTRFGFEFDTILRARDSSHTDQMTTDPLFGMVVQVYLGWAL